MASFFDKSKEILKNLKLQAQALPQYTQQSQLAQNVRGFLNKPVQNNFVNRGIVNTAKPIAQLPNQYGKGFSEASSYGLYNSPIQGPKTMGQSLAYGVGFGAGMLNPINPVNKFSLFSKLGSLGAKPTSALISKVAPKSTGFVAKKLLPSIASEVAQTAGYGLAKTGLGQSFNPVQDFAVGFAMRGLGKFQPDLPFGKTQVKGAAQFKKPVADVDANDIVKNINIYKGSFGLEGSKYPKDVVKQAEKSEKFLREMAGDYIDKTFAKKAPMANVMDELANRLKVDYGDMISMGIKGKDTQQSLYDTKNPIISKGQRLNEIEQRIESVKADASLSGLKPSPSTHAGFITTKGKFAAVNTGHTTTLGDLGEGELGLNNYLDAGGIRTRVAMDNGDINIEIHKAPTTEQMKLLENLPSDRRYFFDIDDITKNGVSGSAQTKDQLISAIKKQFFDDKSGATLGRASSNLLRTSDRTPPRYAGTSGSPTNVAQGGLSEVKGPMMGFAGNQIKSQVSSTDDYLKELVNKQQKAGNFGAPQTIKAKIGGVLADLKAKLVDETAPIQDLLSGAEKNGNFQVLPKNDVRLQIDRVLRSKNLASQFAEDNGLVDAIKKAPNINALDQYMIAKQAATVEKNGIKTGRDLVRDQQLIKDLSPQYEQIAQQVNQYSRKLLDYLVKTGLIDKNLATELVKKYPEYVPLNRVFNELEKATPRGTGKGVASLSKQTVVQRLEGSEREISSPIESLLLKTQDAFSQGERNIAAKQLASYKDLPGFEGVIKETKSGSLAPHTFSYIDNGVKKMFATTPEIEAAAKSLNVEQMGLLGKILSTPTRVLQLGATGLNLPFVVTNMLKDEMTGFVNSNRAAKTSLLNPANYVKSLFSALKHDDLYKEVVRNAAGGTSFDIARQAPNLSVEKLRNPKMYTVKHPLELLRAIENIVGRGEEVGRIKNYAGTKQALLSEGRTAEDAMLLGAKAARENTANFARRGSWGRVLNWVIPFFNAGIQGARQLVGNFQARPAQTATKVAVTIFAPMAAVTAWNLSDPQRKQIYQDIPQYEKENNLVIIPENPTQDAKGRWNVIKVPLPPGLSNLASLVRRPMESAEGLDPVRFGEIANNLITAETSIDVSNSNKLASTFTPQIAKPFVENVTNTNLFTGQKIVPEYLKNRLPEEQVKATTSEGARLIGKTLNISPLKVENFAQSQLGGLGSQLLGKESVAGNIERRFSKASSGALVDKIYTESDSFSALDARIKSLVETGKKEEARALITKNKQILLRGEIANDFKKQLSEYYTDRNKVLNSQTLTPEQKQKILLAIQKRITETSSMYSKVIAKQNL